MMKLQMLDESIDVDDISDCSKMWRRATQSSTNDLFLLLRCRCLNFRLPFSITILFLLLHFWQFIHSFEILCEGSIGELVAEEIPRA